MQNSKINIFLEGYLNSTNAQNLNCLALTKHLDKKKFTIYTLELYSGNLASEKGKFKNVHIFKCTKPFRISKYIAYLWGIWKADVAYLPKRELKLWTSFCLTVFRTKSFSTVEGVLDDIVLQSIDEKALMESFKGVDKLYSITDYMRYYNYNRHGILCEKKILYLGTDFSTFNQKSQYESVENIIMIGSDLVRKGIYDFFDIAKAFPELNFHIAGSGLGKIDVNKEKEKLNLSNLYYHGSLNRNQLTTLLQKMHIHILPSRSEGFPKVILETAAAGIPSIVFGDYGAREWISNEENGFVISELDDAKTILKDLKSNPAQLQILSQNSIELAKRFDWKVLIKDWEKEIENLIN